MYKIHELASHCGRDFFKENTLNYGYRDYIREKGNEPISI
jgi:hypothetical protein